ncbi:DNA-packaging protein [Candidatus Hydrogenosomobacter endosymbioticus]|uniref:Large terminase n=1 Tax=Candidatus Hydrogenosomobacter endosymbioticus TaxID=2558174 RepID=A0ABM7V874_9PROT|nr:terminase family protein [Candidatus Hydrogenosomobacter endosymbioticus]BDB95977.1 large terminase [Candidatus Hydrogenosomobacter endosymbioticus]
MDKNRAESMIKLLRREQSRRVEVALRYDWHANARQNQKEPKGDWRIWLILAGRGFGKTRTGAETIRSWISSGKCKRICLLGETFDDVRSVMIEGQSGLLSVFPDDERPTYLPSLRTLIWKNGAIATGYSAQAYQQLRGPQFDGAWIDELAKFSYADEAFNQLMFCMRLGKSPKTVITTTPRPSSLIRKLSCMPDVFVTTGSTFENQANLSESYIDSMKRNYLGTRIGAQELEGQILNENNGALWRPSFFKYIERSSTSLSEHSKPTPDAEHTQEMKRVVIAVDPAVTCNEDSDETGIIVAGLDNTGTIHILDDLSGKFNSTQWISDVAAAFERYSADKVIAEVNNGGDLVEQLLHTLYPNIPYKAVRAMRGKYVRAEPIAALYEQGRVIHAKKFPILEEQLLSYTPDSKNSPDRLDALVWAATELAFNKPTENNFKIWQIL